MSTVWDVVVSAFGARPEADEVLKAALVLFHPDQPHELRGLPSGRSRLVRLSDPDRLLSAVQELADDRGLYYTLNPVQGDLGDRAAKNGDVTQRWNLLIDVDPVKSEPDAMATDGEKEAAYALASLVLKHLNEQHWPAPVLIDSGNGWHLIYRVDLPANDHARVIIGRVLKALAEKLNTEHAKIDTKVHNSSRISKLPGTWVRKGNQSDDRPHRMAHLLWAPDRLEAVSLEQLEAIAGVQTDPAPEPAAKLEPWDIAVKEGPDKVAAYVKSAVERELARVLLAPEGERNDTLNRAAFSLGQFVGAGLLDGQEATTRLSDVAQRSGLGQIETVKTIESGLETGKQQPRVLPASVVGPIPSANGHAKLDARIDPSKRIIILASEVKPRKVEWLWPAIVPIGKLTTFAGWGGLGKSFVTMDLAARISQGDEVPGNGGLCFAPGNVLILNTEDDPDDTSVPRLIEAGANLKRIAFARSEILGRFTLADLKTLDVMIEQTGGVRMVVIDPATAHLGEVNDHHSAELQGLLTPLKLWAMARRVAVILVTHVNKGSAAGVEAMARVLGSVAWVNAVRAAIMFAKDPQDRSKRLFIPFKTNSGPEKKGLAYQIETTNNLARVKWLGEVDTSADEALAGAKAPRAKNDWDQAIDWMRGFLSTGRRKGDDVVDAGEAQLKLDKHKNWWRKAFQRIPGWGFESGGFSGGTYWIIRTPELSSADGADGVHGADGAYE